MADHDGRFHENDIYVDYAGEVSEAQLSYLTPGPTWSQESSQDGDSYVNAVMRGADDHIRQEQEKRTQGMGPREGAVPGQQSGLTDPHRQTDQAKDTRAYAHEKDEAASLSALRKDQTQRDESKAAAVLREDQTNDTRAHMHGKDEAASLSALRKDQTQRNESTVAATLKDDQAKTKDVARQKTEQSAERDAKAKQQEQQRGKEKQHDKGPTQGR